MTTALGWEAWVVLWDAPGRREGSLFVFLSLKFLDEIP